MRRSMVASAFLSLSIAVGVALVWAEGGTQVVKQEESSEHLLNSPLREIEMTVAELVEVVEAHSGDEDVEVRRAKLREVIEPRFDFEEMSARSLGVHWNNITDQERQEFVRLFSDLLADTYLNRIENIRRDTVSVEGERIVSQNAIVRTIVTHRSDRFPIDYRLIVKNGQWQVYDVIIENIGLVANYRNEFAGIIRKEKMSGLLQRLREKKG